MVNDKNTIYANQRGWGRNSIYNDVTVLKITTLTSNSLNPLFDLNLITNFDLSNSFMFKNDFNYKPVMLGKSSAFYTGVTDGFILRDTRNTETCISYGSTSITFSQFFLITAKFCFFTPTGVNLIYPYN